MAKLALYVRLIPKPGKAGEVEAFLKQGAVMAKDEPGTVHWYGIKEDDGVYSVFDTFDNEAGRDAHLNGEIAKALMAKADELFAEPPHISKISILGYRQRLASGCRRGPCGGLRRCSLWRRALR